MTIRTTMQDLVDQLRTMVDAGTADYTVGTVDYWTDAQLQTVLDGRSQVVDWYPMTFLPQRNGTAGMVYKIYDTGLAWWEASPLVLNSLGGTIGSANYTFDANLGRFTFTADQMGSARMVSGTIYDLNRAAADIWKQKAAHYATAYDFSTDNHSMKRSQLMAQCNQAAAYFASQAGPTVVNITRGDDVSCG